MTARWRWLAVVIVAVLACAGVTSPVARALDYGYDGKATTSSSAGLRDTNPGPDQLNHQRSAEANAGKRGYDVRPRLARASARRAGYRLAPQAALRATGSTGSGARLPMTYECVCQVASKYGIDISDVRININKARIGYRGSTAPDETITLTRRAFDNEEQLARTLAHERFHVDQLRSGMGYPKEYDSFNAWETQARQYEDEWWSSHPLNR